jgi:glucuronate isomerase
MTDTFIHEDFLLDSAAARSLYHDYAREMPIIDYHCHLPPEDVAENRQWENMAQVWLGGDHYKWRAMRTNGVDERYVTGDAPDDQKFAKWAECMPKLLRNPLYHWAQMELRWPFGIKKLLNADTCQEVYQACNEKLQQPEFSARGLMEWWKVKVVCTTDDPTDSLEHHKAIARDSSFKIKVLPSWRPDKAMAVDDPKVWNAYVNKLGESADVFIRDYATFMDAVTRRHAYFHQNGCRVSDHGLETVYAADFRPNEIKRLFAKIRAGSELAPEEIEKFKSAMLYEFALMDHEKGWVQQYHLGAMRNNNTRMFEKLGPDTGFDSIGEWTVAQPLSRFLDRLDVENRLAPTILYNLNPVHNEVLATMLGNFQDGSMPGKMQFGSGWWFLDQLDGMRRQIEALSQLGSLSQFVGMLTDSRSFLSYARHDYFRRLLCGILAADMEAGLIPEDYDLVGKMVQDISYNNAKDYFGFDLE